MTDLRENPDVKTGIRLTLVEMLYDRKISISEFKEYCTKNGIDYESVEHCCGCAGCYDPTESGICTDYDYDHLPCKIIEPKYCNICGQGADIGFPFVDKNGKVVFTFWTCPTHASDKELEDELNKGTSVEWIVKKWNR